MMIAGRLGVDPEMCYTPEGSPVTNFSVAVQEPGAKKATWSKVATWGKPAEVCNEHLLKGRVVLAEGKMKRSTWEDKEGNRREAWQLRGDCVTFLPGGARRAEEPDEIDEDFPF